MNSTIDFSRQTDLFDPINQRFKIKILGAGSLGSFITLNLAKLGFNDIEVWDFDYVESGNIANQFYRIKDINSQKVNALKDIIKEFTNVDIIIHNEKVDEKTNLNVCLNDLFILTFDSLKSRKIVFNLLKDYFVNCLDVRCGGEEYIIYNIDTNNKESLKMWEDSFNIVPTNLPCGAKSIIYTNLSVSSETCNIVKRLNNYEDTPTKLIRCMKSYKIINNLK